MADELVVQVDWTEIDTIPREIEAAAVRGVEKALKALEEVQATSYEANSNPAKPAGSRYQRTFALKRASRTRILNPRFPTIIGRWDLDGSIDYGEKVIGPASDQDPIHRGRWKSEEEVLEIWEPMAPQIIDDEIQKAVSK